MATFGFKVTGELDCKGLDGVVWDEEKQTLTITLASTVTAHSADDINPRALIEGNTGVRITKWEIAESSDEQVERVPAAFDSARRSTL